MTTPPPDTPTPEAEALTPPPPRRLTRLARILPVLGVILFALPTFWHGPEPVRTSQVMLYIFAAWLGLIAVAYCVRRTVSRPLQDASE